jgi:predicted nucleic acid-binding protein
LKAFYEKIFITPAVWKKVVEDGGGRPGAQEITEAHTSSWIEILAPANESVVKLLERELHK